MEVNNIQRRPIYYWGIDSQQSPFSHHLMNNFMDKSFSGGLTHLALGAFNKEKAFSEYCKNVREILLTALQDRPPSP